MELKRVTKNTVTSLEGQWCHRKITKYFGVPQINWRWSPLPLHWLQSHPAFTSYTKSGLTSFRQLQRFPETPVSSLEEHQFQQSNSRKAPYTPYRLEKRADSQALTEQASQLSTSTSRGGFPQQQVCERDPEFAASSGMDTKMSWLERRLDFPAMAWMQARVSCHNMKGCPELLWGVLPVMRSWRKYRAGKAVWDPIHDEVTRKIPDRQGRLGYGRLQVGPGLNPTYILPNFSAVVLVCPAVDSRVACRELSCSSFIE